MIFRKAREYDFLIPNRKTEVGGEKYEGAMVLEPHKGYYLDPIATLDFSSLYPSIMIAHNLCYTTLCHFWQTKNMKPGEDFEKTPTGDYFVKKHVREGIIPKIMNELIDARNKAKKDLAAATDDFERAVLDGR